MSCRTESLEKIQVVALRLLTVRDYAAAELAEKLRGKHYSHQLVDQVIQQLLSRNYLNDVRFATRVLHTRIKRGYAPALIQRMLENRGITRTCIDEALGQIDVPPESVLIRELCKQRRFLPPKPDLTRPQKKQHLARLYRFLIRRGFSRPAIYEFIDGYKDQADDTACH